MKISGMGEQAIRVQHWELRRLHELPEEVQIVGILPELPERSPPLPTGWVPHPRPQAIENRCLYIHVSHRYCYRVDHGPLIIEELDEFLKRWAQIREDELSKRGQPVPASLIDSWVDDYA